MITMMLALALAQDVGRDDAVRKLATQKISVDFQNVKLGEALDFLRDASGLNLVLLPAAAAKDAEQPVKLKAKDLPLKSVLKLMLHSRGLTVAWRDGALAVVPVEDLQDNVSMKLYDVRSQLVKIADFAGPRMELVSPTGPQNGPVMGIDLFEPKPILEPEFLVDLIRSNTGGRSWDGGKATIDLVDGRLVVTQTPAVHREIDALLQRVGQYR